MVDKDAGRQMIAMEFLGGDDALSYEKVIGFEKGGYKQVGVNFECEKKSVEETCGAGLTFDDVVYSIVENLAALHYYHWNDKSVM